MTRKERGRLLLVSVISIIMGFGYVPTKISSLGLEFNADHQSRLLVVVLLGITIYFLFVFLLYLSSDTYLWKMRINSAIYDGELRKLTEIDLRNMRVIGDFTFMINSIKNVEKRAKLIELLNDSIEYQAHGMDLGNGRSVRDQGELLTRLEIFNNSFNEAFFKNRWKKLLITHPLSASRIIIDLILPIALAIYSIQSLIQLIIIL